MEAVVLSVLCVPCRNAKVVPQELQGYQSHEWLMDALAYRGYGRGTSRHEVVLRPLRLPYFETSTAELIGHFTDFYVAELSRRLYSKAGHADLLGTSVDMFDACASEVQTSHQPEQQEATEGQELSREHVRARRVIDTGGLIEEYNASQAVGQRVMHVELGLTKHAYIAHAAAHDPVKGDALLLLSHRSLIFAVQTPWANTAWVAGWEIALSDILLMQRSANKLRIHAPPGRIETVVASMEELVGIDSFLRLQLPNLYVADSDVQQEAGESNRRDSTANDGAQPRGCHWTRMCKITI